MNKDRYRWLLRLLGPVLSLLMAAGLLAPSASLAKIRESTDRGGGGGGINEGDPLDSNDHSSGDGEDDSTEHRQNAVDGGSRSLLPYLHAGARILLIPEFQSGTLVFRIVIVEDSTRGSEE